MVKKAAKPPPMLSEIADLRARGASWEKVAKELQLNMHTIKKWPQRYRMAWAKALGAARRELQNELMAESLLQLRKLLRSKKETIIRDSATRLLQYFSGKSRRRPTKAGARRSPTNDFDRIATHLAGMSNEEVLRVYNHCRKESPLPDGAAGVAPSSSSEA